MGETNILDILKYQTELIKSYEVVISDLEQDIAVASEKEAQVAVCLTRMLKNASLNWDNTMLRFRDEDVRGIFDIVLMHRYESKLDELKKGKEEDNQ